MILYVENTKEYAKKKKKTDRANKVSRVADIKSLKSQFYFYTLATNNPKRKLTPALSGLSTGLHTERSPVQ